MTARPRTFIPAFLTLIGTIIGAGVFGVPAVLQRAGFVAGSVVFWLVALLVLAMHLLFVEIIVRDPKRRRLPGYVGELLGSWAEKAGAFTHSFQLIGANLAYLILGGEFLAVIAGRFGFHEGLLSWQILFWICGVITVMLGLRLMAKVEASMTWMLLAVMVALIILALPRAGLDGVVMSNWSQAHIGLGIFLFALSGLTVIPEVYEIAGKKIRQTRLAVTLGTLLAALLTWLFGITLYMAAQGMDLSTPAALNALLPPGAWWILPLFGFLAVATSFITSAFDLQAMYIYDLKFGRAMALVLTAGAPFILLFLTSRDFLNTIGTVGALFATTNGLLIVAAAGVAMNRSARLQPFWWRVVVPFLAGALFIFTLVQRLVAFGV